MSFLILSKEKLYFYGSARIFNENNVVNSESFVADNNLQIGLIKVDIEGLEQDFLKGAENTIKTQKPALTISIHNSASDFFEINLL